MRPLDALRQWALLDEERWADFDPARQRQLSTRADPRVPLELCYEGLLKGGLAVALDVRGDELFGSLCERIGGSARSIKVDDVTDRGVLELHVTYEGVSHVLEAPTLALLVDDVNRLLEREPKARAVAVLGEWEEMLQLWALPKSRLPALLGESWFQPENGEQLVSLARRR
jgi:hypothetical protein